MAAPILRELAEPSDQWIALAEHVLDGQTWSDHPDLSRQSLAKPQPPMLNVPDSSRRPFLTAPAGSLEWLSPPREESADRGGCGRWEEAL